MICAKYGGRPHWGKRFTRDLYDCAWLYISASYNVPDLSVFLLLSISVFPHHVVPVSKLYPRWDDFCALRAKVDPHGMFVNAYAQRLFRIDADGKPL
jgi:hypothetical protein